MMEVSTGFRFSSAGLVPIDWDVVPFLQIVRIANGQVDPKVEPYKSMVLVAPDHIESETGRLLRTATAVEQGAISGKYLFDQGDIIYSKIRPYLRKAIVANFPGLCSADMYPFKAVNGSVPGYVFAVILGNRFSKYAESVSVRSGMPKINREELSAFSMAMPPVAEQIAIADALRDIDALLDGLDRLIAKKRNLKQAAMQQLLTGQTRLPGFSGEWATAPLGEHCELITKGTTPTSIGKSFTVSGINFLKAESLGEDGDLISEKVAYIADDTHRLLKRSQLKRGDLLLSIAGVIGRVGKVRDEHLPANTNQALAIVRLRMGSEIERNFLFFFLRSPHATKQMSDVNVQAAQSNISLRNVSELQIYLPPTREEQIAISTMLEDFETELSALESRRSKTHALKQAMMQELLTGRIRLVAPEPKAELQT